MLEQIIKYFENSAGEYCLYLGQHLELCFISLTAAILIGLPLGYLGSKNAYLAKICQTFSQLLRIVPSLAVIFILIPIIGTGMLPAILALVFLGLAPIVTNTIVGINEIPNSIKEVGLSLGMNEWQLFKQVIVPLALPYWLNGVKLALIEIFASATLAAYIGAGGLGTLIFTGLSLYRMDYVIVGGFSVALISFVIMVGFDLLIRKVKQNG
ncbi:ABC transporter permease [Lactobacillus corticis]|uniref:Glycine betaine/carnitine/choline ABC transporter permease protein n=1 Tax=Lactobacillus corticis TaxID=2201249 RepID=A0A916VIN7_9LACO|nr:ABC transporter permease [Lactobacillus corticis]GFZ27675.1 glycine betaine/carnitine/choline ABC transporter permease protein [Lactobacillus corticis]